MNLFFSPVVDAASTAPIRLGRVGVKIMTYYLLTTVIAVIFGLIFGDLFRPGEGLNSAEGKALAQPSVIDTLLKIITANVFESLAMGDVRTTTISRARLSIRGRLLIWRPLNRI
jgi:Na+/H+-dicarboxylate symporter